MSLGFFSEELLHLYNQYPVDSHVQKRILAVQTAINHKNVFIKIQQIVPYIINVVHRAVLPTNSVTKEMYFTMQKKLVI
jgi:hypothetical protein